MLPQREVLCWPAATQAPRREGAQPSAPPACRRDAGFLRSTASVAKVALFHYATKSEQDFAVKMQRGSAIEGKGKPWSFFHLMAKCGPTLAAHAFVFQERLLPGLLCCCSSVCNAPAHRAALTQIRGCSLLPVISWLTHPDRNDRPDTRMARNWFLPAQCIVPGAVHMVGTQAACIARVNTVVVVLQNGGQKRRHLQPPRRYR